MIRLTLIGLACAALCFPQAVLASEAHGSVAGHKHIALFLGTGKEDDGHSHTHDADAIGLEFQYRLDAKWAIGAVLERVDVGSHTSTVLVVPFSRFFGDSVRVFGGPGYEFKPGARKDKALLRAGIGYEFELNEKWSLAPEAQVDLIEGGANTWLVGVAIGYGFH